MGNTGSRQYTYHQYYNVIKKDKKFDFNKIIILMISILS